MDHTQWQSRAQSATISETAKEQLEQQGIDPAIFRSALQNATVAQSQPDGPTILLVQVNGKQLFMSCALANGLCTVENVLNHWTRQP